ncbi:MAG: serine/threonine protein kinase [Deltaproteobacteria bacterium]|jgi:serine/threonine protein kinase|nr:serine/threonine protein kinase [Deltaproteobacteria bacterium]
MTDVNSSLPPGFTLDHYWIESVLGQGGNGLTYRAVDQRGGQKVVIKEHFPSDQVGRVGTEVRPLSVEADQAFRLSLTFFLKEAQTLSRFNQANIVPIINFFQAQGTAYFVMPFLEGMTLADLVALSPQGRQTEKEVWLWLSPILAGLKAIHSKGILHRDLTPSNIFIQTDSNPVLIDFGSAGNILAGEKGNFFLTPGFAPPEQYEKTADAQGPWTDIYSLGAVLFFCLTGFEPPKSVDRLLRITSGQPDPLAAFFADLITSCNPQLIWTIQRSLEPTIQDRIQGVAEMEARLKTLSPAARPAPPAKGGTILVKAAQSRPRLNLTGYWLELVSFFRDIKSFLFKDKTSIVIFIVLIILIAFLIYS